MNAWYLLPGMGADSSMYDLLRQALDFEINFINWPKYNGETTYSETAKRIIEENGIKDGDIVEGSFDTGKSERTKKKHGIDFYEGQEIWDDPDFIEIPLKTSDEERFLVIGKISEKCWSAIITYRSEKIRLISIRRSRKEEVDIYES